MRYVTLQAIGILLAVSACTGVWINEPGDGQNYYNGAFEFASGSGSMKAVVLGQPFRNADENLAAKTAALMKGATRGPVVTFEPAEWTTPDNSFRVVVLFNGNMPFAADDLCSKGAEIAVDPNQSPARMDATFCYGKHMLSFANGYARKLTGTDDPEFRELVRGVALAMTPPLDDRQMDGNP